jgi:uncharacterized repeat protein (TIGR03847 family)
MADEYEFGSVDFITVGTIGPPGQRVFHLQAKQDDDLLTLIIEKEQASALAETILALIEKIQEDLDLPTDELNLQQLDLALLEPILPVFRVAQMGLGYDDNKDVLILVVSELLPEDAETEPRHARPDAGAGTPHAERRRAGAANLWELRQANRPGRAFLPQK